MSMTTGSERTAVGWALRSNAVLAFLATITRRSVVEKAAIVYFVGVFLFVGAYTWLRPDYNWDMVAYVATALENRYQDPQALHAETWREIEQGARESQLYNLQYGNPYNRHQWENPVDFQSQLSMYRVKVGYIALMRLMEPVTGLVTASLLISILPLLGIGALTLYWLGREKALQAALLLAPVFVVADIAHMSAAVTPDLLMALLSLAALYWISKGRDAAACLLLFASVFVRPDNIILIFALLITAVIFGWRLRAYLVCFAAAFVACTLISRFGDHPGWWAHFYFSCVRIQDSMIGFHPDFSLVDMAKGYMRGVTVSLMDNDWPALLVALLFGWALLARAGRMGTGRANALMFALAIGTLGKFASFPLPDDRFYFVFIAGMAVIVAVCWKPRFNLS